jgi:hypothetical protein
VKSRPWLWIVIGYAAFLVALGTAITIMIRNSPQEIPVARHDH